VYRAPPRFTAALRCVARSRSRNCSTVIFMRASGPANSGRAQDVGYPGGTLAPRCWASNGCVRRRCVSVGNPQRSPRGCGELALHAPRQEGLFRLRLNGVNSSSYPANGVPLTILWVANRSPDQFVTKPLPEQPKRLARTAAIFGSTEVPSSFTTIAPENRGGVRINRTSDWMPTSMQLERKKGIRVHEKL